MLSASDLVPIDSLLPADSPRLDGEDPAHVCVLAETDAVLPPILVHRASMRVIDGMHRLKAAVLRGEDEIEVRFFDGSEEAAFVLAVKANIAHGLPLSKADREQAAARIAHAHPQWSDRAIAMASGLSGKTVAAIRHRATEESPQLHMRVGLDGRVRPLSTAEGRRIAGRLVTEEPQASLRQIAKRAGISMGTARDVRARVRRGEDPVPTAVRRTEASSAAARGAEFDGARDLLTIMHNLRRDPSIRFSEAGRSLLHWLATHSAGLEEWEDFIGAIPPHCMVVTAELASRCSESWGSFADELRRRTADDAALAQGVS